MPHILGLKPKYFEVILSPNLIFKKLIYQQPKHLQSIFCLKFLGVLVCDKVFVLCKSHAKCVRLERTERHVTTMATTSRQVLYTRDVSPSN